MLILTTDELQGKKITQYMGLVSGEVAMGENELAAIFGGISDVVGGQDSSFASDMDKAREVALNELKELARILGANAVIGVDLDYDFMKSNQGVGVLMLTINGTAVTLEDE